MPSIASMQIEANELTLRDDANAPRLTATRLNSTTIENRQWNIEAFFDGNALVGTTWAFGEHDASPIVFAGGLIQGSPGCGALDGEYSLHGSRIRISAGFFLAGVCINRRNPSLHVLALAEQATRATRALSGDRIIVRQGPDRILLRNEAGQVQIVLIAMR